MRRALFVSIVVGILGMTLLSGAAVAGQFNALGQYVPESTEEGWQGLGGERTGGIARVIPPTSGNRPTQARPAQVRPRSAVRTDSLGQQVPVRTSRP